MANDNIKNCFGIKKIITIEWFIVFILFFIQALFYWSLPPNFLDEGIWLELTRWVANGMDPYVDFPTVYGPFYLHVLSAGVTFLGGKLIALRIFMGCIQGFFCFILLRWSLRKVVDDKVAFSICVLSYATIAHPSLDATMFWGLRYYSALIFITPLCLDISGKIALTSFHRYLLFFLWGPLFFYSGEAGVIAIPVVGISLIWTSFNSSSKLNSFVKSTAFFASGLSLCYFVLNEEFLLYAQELLIKAPITYRQMGFSYPKLSLTTLHFYYPFLLLILSIFSMGYFRMKFRSILSLGAMSLALVPALKVATSRSDEVHLAYSYPFVIFLTFLLTTTSSIYFKKPKFQNLWQGFWIVSLVFCLLNFLSPQLFKVYYSTFSSVGSEVKRTYNARWGIWMPKNDFAILKESSDRIRNLLSFSNSRLFIFPFQQILYSELSLQSLSIEPIQPCSLKSNRAICSRNFNDTFPNQVLWVPEGSMYSWAFDAYFSGFEYPEAFETLESEFNDPIKLGRSGWLLYERSKLKPSNQLRNYFKPQAQDFEQCETSTSACPFLEFMSESLRLPPFKMLTCLKPSPKTFDEISNSFGVQIPPSTIDQIGVDILWTCKDSGSANCLCSRVRVRSQTNEPYTKWAWDGFADWQSENVSRLSFFGIPNK